MEKLNTMKNQASNFTARIYKAKNNSLVVALMYKIEKNFFVEKFHFNRFKKEKLIRMQKEFKINAANDSFIISLEEDRGEMVRLFEKVSPHGYLAVKVSQ